MGIILPFVSLIGVVVGFCLGWLKEYIQNKPKLKADVILPSGRFSYYKKAVDNEGIAQQIPCKQEEANFLSLKLRVDIFNIGKASTAVHTIDIGLKVDEFECIYTPQAKLKESDTPTKDISFNVAPGNIQTVHLDLLVEKDDNTNYLFTENIHYDLDREDRLLIIIYIKDIYNKELKIIVEPLAIYTFF